MNLIETLITQCASKDACAKGMRDLKPDLSIQELCKLFVKYSDFCFEYNTPTLDLIRGWKGQCEEYGVFVDDEVVGLQNESNVILNGDCKATLEYDQYSVSRVWIRHNSKAAVNVSDHAYITLDVMDNSSLVVAVAGNDAQVIVDKYGDAQVECIGSGIIVNNKQ